MVSLKYCKTSNKRKKKDLFGYKQATIYYLHLISLFIVKNIKLVKPKNCLVFLMPSVHMFLLFASHKSSFYFIVIHFVGITT